LAKPKVFLGEVMGNLPPANRVDEVKVKCCDRIASKKCEDCPYKNLTTTGRIPSKPEMQFIRPNSM